MFGSRLSVVECGSPKLRFDQDVFTDPNYVVAFLSFLGGYVEKCLP